MYSCSYTHVHEERIKYIFNLSKCDSYVERMAISGIVWEKCAPLRTPDSPLCANTADMV